MLRYSIGRYIYFDCPIDDRRFVSNWEWRQSDIESYDRRLHQSLDKIFHERCSSSTSSSQFKFRRDLQHSNDWKSMIKPILEHEPALSKHFSMEELGKISLLWISVLAGYEKSAELLVRSGADVSERFGRHDPQVIDEKWTILQVLMRMNPSPENERLIRLVVDHGADLQARDYKGRTALHLAVIGGQVKITEMLLHKGADVNATDYDAQTPLLMAMTDGRKTDELLPLLIKHGADVLAKDRQGTNLLHVLGISNYIVKTPAELVRVCIERGVSLDDTAGLGQNKPLHLAAMSGNDEIVKLFLDHGAHVNVQNANGESPLYLAAWHGKNTVVETLLDRGAHIGLKTTQGRSALHGPCENSAKNSLPLLRWPPIPMQQIPALLHILGPEEQEQRIVGITDTIKLLLSAGADVLAEDSDGDTPLSLILSNGKVEQPGIRFLIKALPLKKTLQPSMELKDEKIIEQYPELRNHYHEYFEEIDKMKSTRFIHTCTVFELLVKSYCQIAALMRNPEFATKFKQCDLNGFSTYAEDIRRAFERAQNHYQPMVKQEDVIIDAFYNILPDLIVDKVVHYIFDCCKNMK